MWTAKYKQNTDQEELGEVTATWTDPQDETNTFTFTRRVNIKQGKQELRDFKRDAISALNTHDEDRTKHVSWDRRITNFMNQ